MSFHLANSSLERLATWFDSNVGRRLLAEQAPVISDCARRFHGDTLLWAGCHTDLTDTVRGCMIRNRFHLETCGMPDAGPGEGDTGLFRADLHELPLRNNALDAVVLHHVLETARDPRGSMREVARVLAPGGRLLIVSFNPWSLWGLRSAYARFFNDSFSGLRFVSSQRLQDWLAVLGFELQQEVKYLAYEFPFGASGFQSRQAAAREGSAPADGVWQKIRTWCAKRRLPVGGVYVISAVKQASAVSPDWRRSPVSGRELVPAAYPKVSARIAYLPGVAPSVASTGVTSPPAEGIEDPG